MCVKEHFAGTGIVSPLDGVHQVVEQSTTTTTTPSTWRLCGSVGSGLGQAFGGIFEYCTKVVPTTYVPLYRDPAPCVPVHGQLQQNYQRADAVHLSEVRLLADFRALHGGAREVVALPCAAVRSHWWHLHDHGALQQPAPPKHLAHCKEGPGSEGALWQVARRAGQCSSHTEHPGFRQVVFSRTDPVNVIDGAPECRMGGVRTVALRVHQSFFTFEELFRPQEFVGQRGRAAPGKSRGNFLGNSALLLVA